MSYKMFLKDKSRDRFSHCVRQADEQDVQSGLSLTPDQIYKMAEKGLPVTTRNLGVTYDEGYSQLDFEPPLEHLRGVDIGDLYEARMAAKEKMRTLRQQGKFESAKIDEGAK